MGMTGERESGDGHDGGETMLPLTTCKQPESWGRDVGYVPGMGSVVGAQL
jgi:hypothetical protein